jgi:PPOX class probable F420-dependent enzyme
VGVPLSDAACSLLDAANIGHFATLMPGGEPKVEPVWVGREGDLVLVTTDERSLKARNVVADARVALSVTDATNPYRQLLVRGRVVELRPDNDLVVLDAFSQKYLGAPFPRRRWSTRVVLVIEPSLARAYTSPLADLVQPDAPRRTP